MNDQPLKILGINVSNLSFKEVLESLEKYLNNFKFQISNFKLEGVKPLVIFTPNPEIVVYAQKDDKFKEIVNAAQINIPDGVGLIWASKFLGKPLKERISGVDLMEKLAELSARKGLTVGLIGGKGGVALKALECLQEKYPGLKGWADEGPRLRHCEKHQRRSNLDCRVPRLWRGPRNDVTRLIKKIRETKTSFLFVGLGAPKQEYFINNLCHSEASAEESHKNQKRGGDPSLTFRMTTCPLVLMAVGGSFDYLSGRVKRAPLFIRAIGFEWVFRFVVQPWRIKRQLALIKFIWLVIKQKLEMT